MIRAVLAVLLASALLGATLPALDDARRERASVTVAEQTQTIERTARRLARTDDPTGDAGARRVVTLSLPASDWTTAAVETLSIGPASGDAGGRIRWHVRGGSTHEAMLSVPQFRTDDGGPLVLNGTGHHRLVLALDGRPGDPVVTIRRLK